MHPKGGCRFSRHGTYPRVTPRGTLIARWYCPDAHCTFSLLPDCLAARMPGTLVELEQAVSVAEQAPSQESVCDRLRPGKELQGALRWLRRRLNALNSCLITLKGLMPKSLVGCEPTLAAFSAHLRVSPVLPKLREIAAAHLHHLPAPIGFSPRCSRSGGANSPNQHKTGTDPPSPSR